MGLSRLRVQWLDSRSPFNGLAEVCSEVGGLHAQLIDAAELALWARVKGVRRGVLYEYLVGGPLVRTWLMRGTIHIVPSVELQTYLAALRPSGLARERNYLGRRGIEWSLVLRISDSIHDALDAGPLTRVELANSVGSSLGSGVRQLLLNTWGDLLRPASLMGYLCFGPRRDRTVTFTRPDRIGEIDHAAPDPYQALRTLALTYLRAFCATEAKGFAKWIGSTVGEIRDVWEETVLSAAHTIQVPARGRARRRPEARAASRSPLIRMLPAFDPYIVGSPDRASLVPSSQAPNVFARGGWVRPVILSGLSIVATWRYELNRTSLKVTIQPFRELGSSEMDACQRELASLAQYFGSKRTELLIAS